MAADNIIQRTRPGELPAGHIVDGKYRITSSLGSGSMGHVYLAEQIELKRPVALKIIHEHIAAAWESAERFLREAQLLSRLQHKHIPAFYGYNKIEGQVAYLAMEYVSGRDLREVIAGQANLPVSKAVDIFIPICDALGYAHGKGIVHRDLKPSNVLITGDNRVFVLDFGLAKLLPAEGREILKLTQTGFALGTPSYMSPEQCSSREPAPASDIYSVGCLLYEAMFGVPPFEGTSVLDVMQKQCTEEAAYPPLRPDLLADGEMVELIKACLKKEPSERPPSMDAVRYRLQRMRRHSSDRSSPADDKAERVMPSPRRRFPISFKTVASALIGLTLVVLAVSTLVHWRAQSERRQVVTGSATDTEEDRIRKLASLFEAGQKALAGKKFALAAARLEEANLLCRSFSERIPVLLHQDELAKATGDVSWRRTLLARAYTMLQDQGESLPVGFYACMVGQKLLELGDIQRAEAIIKHLDAWRIGPADGSLARHLQFQILILKGESLYHQHRVRDALAKMAEAVAIADESNRQDHIIVLLRMSTMDKELGLSDAAQRHYAEAKALDRSR